MEEQVAPALVLAAAVAQVGGELAAVRGGVSYVPFEPSMRIFQLWFGSEPFLLHILTHFNVALGPQQQPRLQSR
jgi:hypothetical protein